jgi:hypothetical protein
MIKRYGACESSDLFPARASYLIFTVSSLHLSYGRGRGRNTTRSKFQDPGDNKLPNGVSC